MKDLGNRGSGLKVILTITVLISVFIAGSLVALIATNHYHLGRMIKVVGLVKSQYLEPVEMTQLVDGAMKGIVGSLKDPYSTYLEPKEFKQLQEQIQGSFTGIGIYVAKNEAGQVTVVAPIKGGPAEKVGMKAGDVIVKVNGEDIADLDIDLIISKMRGPEGTKVNVSVFRESAKKVMDFEVQRTKIDIPVVTSEILKEDARIGYIKLSQFSEHAGQDVDRALRELREKKVQGLILDLRGNPGGQLEAARDVASNFIPKGPVVHIVNNSGNRETYETNRTQIDLPLTVLINEGSASASEIVAGAIKDYGTGTIIGTKSFGKGIVQSVIPLDGGAAVKLTTAKYLSPKGNDIHKKGVEPDIKVEATEQEGSHQASGASAADPVVAKAVEVLRPALK